MALGFGTGLLTGMQDVANLGKTYAETADIQAQTAGRATTQDINALKLEEEKASWQQQQQSTQAILSLQKSAQESLKEYQGADKAQKVLEQELKTTDDPKIAETLQKQLADIATSKLKAQEDTTRTYESSNQLQADQLRQASQSPQEMQKYIASHLRPEEEMKGAPEQERMQQATLASIAALMNHPDIGQHWGQISSAIQQKADSMLPQTEVDKLAKLKMTEQIAAEKQKLAEQKAADVKWSNTQRIAISREKVQASAAKVATKNTTDPAVKAAIATYQKDKAAATGNMRQYRSQLADLNNPMKSGTLSEEDKRTKEASIMENIRIEESRIDTANAGLGGLTDGKYGTSNVANTKPSKSPANTPNTLPSVGTVQKGYRYLGGDPHNKASWEKVQ